MNLLYHQGIGVSQVKHKKIKLSETAYLEAYIPDESISYQVKKKWPALIICPGGAYMISAVKEGEAVALQFLAQGYACFVLRYSTFLKNREALQMELAEIDETAYYPTQILQLMTAMHLIRESGDEWGIDTKNIFTIGFSAGAHIAGMAATRWKDETLIRQLEFVPKLGELKPKGTLLCYPMLTGPHRDEQLQVSGFQIDMMELCLAGHTSLSNEENDALCVGNYISSETAPIFIWHTQEDKVTQATDTTKFVEQLQQAGVSCEYHLFQNGQHGLSIANEQYAKLAEDINKEVQLWLPLAFNWMKGMIKYVG